MKVTLLNPEEVVTAFAEIGKFASICKNDCDAKIDFEKIGLIMLLSYFLLTYRIIL